MDIARKPQRYKVYYLYVAIEPQNEAGGYDIFHTIAVGDWLVWEINFFMHTFITICNLVAIENRPIK
jgi:hypothetical protein